MFLLMRVASCFFLFLVSDNYMEWSHLVSYYMDRSHLVSSNEGHIMFLLMRDTSCFF